DPPVEVLVRVRRTQFKCFCKIKVSTLQIFQVVSRKPSVRIGFNRLGTEPDRFIQVGQGALVVAQLGLCITAMGEGVGEGRVDFKSLCEIADGSIEILQSDTSLSPNI